MQINKPLLDLGKNALHTVGYERRLLNVECFTHFGRMRQALRQLADFAQFQSFYELCDQQRKELSVLISVYLHEAPIVQQQLAQGQVLEDLLEEEAFQSYRYSAAAFRLSGARGPSMALILRMPEFTPERRKALMAIWSAEVNILVEIVTEHEEGQSSYFYNCDSCLTMQAAWDGLLLIRDSMGPALSYSNPAQLEATQEG